MFDKTSGAFRHKNETEVRLQLTGAPPLNAIVYHVNGERLSDLLNDPRRFLPVKLEDGQVMIINKDQIVSLLLNDQARAKPDNISDEDPAAMDRAFNPYEMLRVREDASTEEIRAAYKARIKSVHPDKVASLGLDEDLAKAALLTTQKVNYAYRKIMRARGAANSMGAV